MSVNSLLAKAKGGKRSRFALEDPARAITFSLNQQRHQVSCLFFPFVEPVICLIMPPCAVENIDPRTERIPRALQSVFLASNRGKEVHIPPPNNVASKVFSNGSSHGSRKRWSFRRGSLSFGSSHGSNHSSRRRGIGLDSLS